MPDFIRFRFNEQLLGRVIAAKRNGTDCVGFNEHNLGVKVSNTEYPDVKFNSFHDWYASIHRDVQLLEESRRLRAQRDKDMKPAKLYHNSWISAKFSEIY